MHLQAVSLMHGQRKVSESCNASGHLSGVASTRSIATLSALLSIILQVMLLSGAHNVTRRLILSLLKPLPHPRSMLTNRVWPPSRGAARAQIRHRSFTTCVRPPWLWWHVEGLCHEAVYHPCPDSLNTGAAKGQQEDPETPRPVIRLGRPKHGNVRLIVECFRPGVGGPQGLGSNNAKMPIHTLTFTVGRAFREPSRSCFAFFESRIAGAAWIEKGSPRGQARFPATARLPPMSGRPHRGQEWRRLDRGRLPPVSGLPPRGQGGPLSESALLPGLSGLLHRDREGSLMEGIYQGRLASYRQCPASMRGAGRAFSMRPSTTRVRPPSTGAAKGHKKTRKPKNRFPAGRPKRGRSADRRMLSRARFRPGVGGPRVWAPKTPKCLFLHCFTVGRAFLEPSRSVSHFSKVGSRGQRGSRRALHRGRQGFQPQPVYHPSPAALTGGRNGADWT